MKDQRVTMQNYVNSILNNIQAIQETLQEHPDISYNTHVMKEIFETDEKIGNLTDYICDYILEKDDL